MDFTLKLIIPIFIIGLISILCITTHVFDILPSESNNVTINVVYELGDDVIYKQTPYIVQPSPIKIYPITPEPTPTPLYYESLQNPDEPCSETLKKFQSHCFGRTKNEEYCDYWRLESSKKCSFIPW